jgi:hypothetical protein
MPGIDAACQVAQLAHWLTSSKRLSFMVSCQLRGQLHVLQVTGELSDPFAWSSWAMTRHQLVWAAGIVQQNSIASVCGMLVVAKQRMYNSSYRLLPVRAAVPPPPPPPPAAAAAAGLEPGW